jgi:hypothetical protein
VDAGAAARLIAAKLSATLAASSAAALAPMQELGLAAPVADASFDSADPAARARAIAARLSANVAAAGIGGGSVLGKRSAGEAFGGGGADGKRRIKIVLPSPTDSWPSLLIGHKVRARGRWGTRERA